MKSIIVGFLMGHSLGITDSYFKPTEQEVFDEYYSKAVPALTIQKDDIDKTLLQKQVAELAEKGKEETEQTKKELKELKLQNDNNNALLQRVMRILGEVYVKGEGVDAKTIHSMLLNTSIYYDRQGIDGNAYILSLLDRKIKEEEVQRLKKEKEKN